MNAAQRVMLDRRIADERMVELDPHGEEPTALTCLFSGGQQPTAQTIDDKGTLSGRVVLDEVQWFAVVALRLYDPYGTEMDVVPLMNSDYDDFEGDEHAEPSSVVPIDSAVLAQADGAGA